MLAALGEDESKFGCIFPMLAAPYGEGGVRK